MRLRRFVRLLLRRARGQKIQRKKQKTKISGVDAALKLLYKAALEEANIKSTTGIRKQPPKNRREELLETAKFAYAGRIDPEHILIELRNFKESGIISTENYKRQIMNVLRKHPNLADFAFDNRVIDGRTRFLLMKKHQTQK